MGISTKTIRRGAGLIALVAAPALSLAAQGTQSATKPASATANASKVHKPKALTDSLPNLATTPTLFVVGYAHLDTEWNWDYVATIGQYLPKTMHSNFALFEKYPDYIFNFTGANRYRLMKEYYPADYATMKKYIAADRWFPAGSSMEEGDVNAPSAEGILRQFLYGNEYFRNEFGKASAEFMLPDCFGFPWSLPTLLAHAGIKGFSTQKLVWGSSVPDQPTTPYKMEGKGVPFNYGFWKGPDGKGVVLAANPGSYSASENEDISTAKAVDRSVTPAPQAQTWVARLAENKQQLGFPIDFHYYGTGDVGGSPTEASVNFVQQSVTNPSPAIHVISSNADQFFKAFTPTMITKLPVWASEMELQNHSAGSLTSEGYIKRWMRRNETLADAAEKASIAAKWTGARTYPMQRLNDAWTLVMAGHFHDIGAGTASVSAYNYAWNDALIAQNQFAEVLTSAVDGFSGALNTQTQGTPVVVYNPLSIAREDIVEATVPFPNGTPAAVRVYGPDGTEVPAQLEPGANGATKVVFSAKVPSVGYAVYDVRPAQSASTAASTLSVTASSLENARYRVQINPAGDVSSIFDKKLNKELLSAPARLAFVSGTPSQWPAWNMDFDDASRPPRGYLGGPATVSITENGPARVAVTVVRSEGPSKFAQTIRLSAGDAGGRVEFSNAIDWRMDSTVVKQVFPLTATNDSASYNLGAGVIKRGTMYDRKFEVGAHQWVDLTDRSGSYGATILTDAKNGSDKPDANTIRLSLIYSPGIPGGAVATADDGKAYGTGGYNYQAWQDWGHHDILYGIAGHAGDYRAGQTDWQGLRLNDPLIAFDAPKHAGALGKTFSLVKVSTGRVQVMALKRAEASSDEIIIRLNELDGKAQNGVHIAFAAPVVAAREVNGQEEPSRTGTLGVIADGADAGQLMMSFGPYALRTFAVKLGPAPTTAHLSAPASQAVTLAYDASVASRDSTKSVGGGFDGKGNTLPAEMLPATLPFEGITFKLASAMEGTPNAVTANGQTIKLPAGTFTRVYLLAASGAGDQTATFKVGDASTDLTIQDWGGFIGQWDQRIMKQVHYTPPAPTAAQLAQQAQAQARQDSLLRVRVDSVKRAGGDTMAVLAGRGGRGGRGGGGAGGRGGNAGPRALSVLDSVAPAFNKMAPVAWYASHHHTADGANAIYEYSYLFGYSIEIPAGAKTLTLPANDKIRILAVTVANEKHQVRPAQPLVEVLDRPKH